MPCRIDGRQEFSLVFAAEFHRQPMESNSQWCHMVSLSFSSERAELHCSEPSANLYSGDYGLVAETPANQKRLSEIQSFPFKCVSHEE